ncbi:probable RNA-binding protein EIF1AD isoform X1 [Leucoraja erinacea]|uniref:probable RNA-binding protein EIF1AD isoform X1 n=1 Tax=Leucoraja erinaceus TaxID=7782 RepID=UPI002457E3D9|nr:probable RNA-binding protein EIF1AD isoform X1 [Leucoraja erinacea]
MGCGKRGRREEATGLVLIAGPSVTLWLPSLPLLSPRLQTSPVSELIARHVSGHKEKARGEGGAGRLLSPLREAADSAGGRLAGQQPPRGGDGGGGPVPRQHAHQIPQEHLDQEGPAGFSEPGSLDSDAKKEARDQRSAQEREADGEGEDDSEDDGDLFVNTNRRNYEYCESEESEESEEGEGEGKGVREGETERG